MRHSAKFAIGAILFLTSVSASAERWRWNEDYWNVSADVFQGQSTFAMTMDKPKTGEKATAKGEIVRDGKRFTITRTQSTDTNHRDCTYVGEFLSDGKKFRGTYTCKDGGATEFFGAVLAPGQKVQNWQWREDNWIITAWGVTEGPRFTLTMFKPKTNESAEAQAEIHRDGNKFTIDRMKSTDTNHRDCKYTGELDSDGKKFSGNYTCTNGVTLPFSGSVVMSD